MKISGSIAVITGGASGLGRATAERGLDAVGLLGGGGGSPAPRVTVMSGLPGGNGVGWVAGEDGPTRGWRD